MKTPIKNLTRVELAQLVKEAGQPAFRAKQLYEWIYVHQAKQFAEMTNLSKAFRAWLDESYTLEQPEVFHKAVSVDGTRKYVFKLSDGCLIESVGIPSGRAGERGDRGDRGDWGEGAERLTVCFSTQVGCAMQCAFCATGKEGFTRNLTIGEIIDQVLLVQDDFGIRVSNLVGMGQGEPFLNYDAVLEAIRILNDPQGIAIGARHITLSTCGIIPGIQRFASEPEQFTLAISLHSAIQEKRDRLMPRTKEMPLPQLKRALQEYLQATNRRVTFEYLLIRDCNDGEEDLAALLDFCHGLLCHVNILPLNDVEGSPWKPSASQTVEHWLGALKSHGIEASRRNSRGADIDGACGQLKNSLS